MSAMVVFLPVGIARNGPICGFIQVLDWSVLNCVASVCDGLEVKLPKHAATLRQVQDHAPAIAQLLLSMPEARLHPVLQALVKEVRLLCDCVNELYFMRLHNKLCRNTTQVLALNFPFVSNGLLRKELSLDSSDVVQTCTAKSIARDSGSHLTQSLQGDVSIVYHCAILIETVCVCMISLDVMMVRIKTLSLAWSTSVLVVAFYGPLACWCTFVCVCGCMRVFAISQSSNDPCIC